MMAANRTATGNRDGNCNNWSPNSSNGNRSQLQPAQPEREHIQNRTKPTTTATGQNRNRHNWNRDNRNMVDHGRPRSDTTGTPLGTQGPPRVWMRVFFGRYEIAVVPQIQIVSGKTCSSYN